MVIISFHSGELMPPLFPCYFATDHGTMALSAITGVAVDLDAEPA